MSVRLKDLKDCKNCINSNVYGTIGKFEIECKSPDYLYNSLFKKDGRFCAAYCKGYEQAETIRSGKIEQDLALQFMLAGKAEFIIKSTKTKQDFRMSITASDKENNDNVKLYFLRVYYGSKSSYAGTVWFSTKENIFKFSKGARGQVEENDIAVRSIIFILNKLYNKEKVEHLELFHIGKCGACGNKLVTEEELKTGIDNICIKGILKND